jgi:hypothetical protein
MKKVILIVCLLPYMAYGQIVDDFEQGSLARWKQNSDGRWNADTTQSIDGSFSLHHVFDNAEAGSDQVGIMTDSLQPSEGTVTWSFRIRHGYDPSSSNNWAVFLMSDTDPGLSYTDDGTNGFAIGVNLTGYDDTLRLWKVKGSSLNLLVNTRLNWQSGIGTGISAGIEVKREKGGLWHVLVTNQSGTMLADASGTDPELFDCNWFIICYKYSSSRDRLLWFDDLSITGVFHVSHDTPSVSPGALVISEIMADPEPVVALPPAEYIELKNRTGSEINLVDWKLSTSTVDYRFSPLNILPGEEVIVCAARDTAKFSQYGKIAALSSFPALTNDGRLLLLYDKTGALIHGVDYRSKWYSDELKSDGGWSLEMTDTDFPFFEQGNWKASDSPSGGTPGWKNSDADYNPDTRFSGKLTFFPADSVHLSVSSPEPLFMMMDLTDSLKAENISMATVVLQDPLYRRFSFSTSVPFLKGKIYEINIPFSVSDFAGNRPSAPSYKFGLPETAGPGDILFNELLFNPLPDEPDYIELYNASGKVIDAAKLTLVSVNDDSHDTSSVYFLSDENRCLLPGNYYLVSVNPEKVIERYPSADQDNIYENEALPSMPDDKGHLILFNRELAKIDEVAYSDKMHSVLISATEGIALEKINPTFSSADRANWQSATAASGWGTPGAPNSVLINEPDGGAEVKLSSTKITPDDDGFEDLLLIRCDPKGSGNVVSVSVFDELGGYVRKIAANLSVGSGADLIWDGKSDDGTLVDTGIYIILIQVYNEYGRSTRWKKVCTVIRR